MRIKIVEVSLIIQIIDKFGEYLECESSICYEKKLNVYNVS